VIYEEKNDRLLTQNTEVVYGFRFAPFFPVYGRIAPYTDTDIYERIGTPYSSTWVDTASNNPSTSTKRISPNNSSDYKINYSASSNSLIFDARSDDIFQFLPSKKIKLNDKLNYSQSSTTRIPRSSNPNYRILVRISSESGS